MSPANPARRSAPAIPQSTWGYIDVVVPGSPSLMFAEHEGAFLVGAAAALTSRTGTIGFVGGFQIAAVERFRAGFEAGARAVNPSIEILATYLALDEQRLLRDDLARAAATDMYARGADVVFHAAGDAGYGVFAAARAASTPATAPVGDRRRRRPVPRCRSARATTRADVDDQEVRRRGVRAGPSASSKDELRPGVRQLGLADDAVGYSTTGGHLSAGTIAALERYRNEIVAGTPRSCRARPTGHSSPLPGLP